MKKLYYLLILCILSACDSGITESTPEIEASINSDAKAPCTGITPSSTNFRCYNPDDTLCDIVDGEYLDNLYSNLLGGDNEFLEYANYMVKQMDGIRIQLANQIPSEFSYISSAGGTLNFTDTADIFLASEKLDGFDSRWNDEYVNRFDTLIDYCKSKYCTITFDDLSLQNAIEDYYVVEEDVIFKDFNRHFRFNSMYTALMEKETIWLDQENPDNANDPTNVPYDYDLWPVINIGGGVNVGGQPIETIAASNITWEKGDCTFTNRKKYKDDYRVPDKRLGFRFVIKQNPWLFIDPRNVETHGKVKATKINKRKWKKDRKAHVGLELDLIQQTQTLTPSCDFPDYMSRTEPYEEKKKKVKQVIYNGGIFDSYAQNINDESNQYVRGYYYREGLCPVFIYLWRQEIIPAPSSNPDCSPP